MDAFSGRIANSKKGERSDGATEKITRSASRLEFERKQVEQSWFDHALTVDTPGRNQWKGEIPSRLPAVPGHSILSKFNNGNSNASDSRQGERSIH